MRFVEVAVNSVILNLLVYFTIIETSFTLIKVLTQGPSVTRMKYININSNHISDIYIIKNCKTLFHCKSSRKAENEKIKFLLLFSKL